MDKAAESVIRALSGLGLEKGSKNLLVLTNAGYGTIVGHTSEAFLDILSRETGCSPGARSMLAVQTPFKEPLWYALYRKDNCQLTYGQWVKNKFQEQTFNNSAEKILNPEAWKKVAAGIAGGGKTLFSIVSISHGWAAGASWQKLKSAEFHNHICPGSEIGHMTSDYLKSRLPLKQGERYYFIGAPPGCPIDILQVLYDATTGKATTFAKSISEEKLKKYSGSIWIKITSPAPLIVIAAKINDVENTCQGVLLGVDLKSLFKDVGENYLDFDPPGGRSNPIRFISRVKVTTKMLAMSPAEKQKYMVEVKKFSGPASLGETLAQEGTDPYAIIWGLQ